MILGHFRPLASEQLSYEPPSARLEPSVDRRFVAFGVAGALLGVVVAVVPTLSSAAAKPDPDPSSLPAWAQTMLTDRPERVLRMAPRFESRARELGDARVAPCFERLLDLALESHAAEADVAGACAARTLERLGRVDLIAHRLGAILARTDLARTTAAALHAVRSVNRDTRTGK